MEVSSGVGPEERGLEWVVTVVTREVAEFPRDGGGKIQPAAC